jgi:Protein of unknown function (DUF3558)
MHWRGVRYATPLIAIALLAGCGSQGKSETSTRTGRDLITTGAVTHHAAPGTGGNSTNDDNPGQADVASSSGKGGSVRPCKLVTRSQAQAILGRSLDAPQEAPLGPTCIYQSSGSTITLTVESIDFAAIKAHLRGRKQTEVAGHRAYCGSYGQQMTYVPLTDGRVLNVTAPCSLGLRFAAAALAHLRS